jgi:protease I
MTTDLSGRRIAILVADGFEQVEMTEPRQALEQAGALTDLVSPQRKEVQGWNHQEKGNKFPVDVSLESARSEDYDGLLLPGGVANPDQLRTLSQAVKFVQGFFKEKKPVAAICHGPWLLVEADAVEGRTLTSWPSLKTDIRNAGGLWVDREVVDDRGLVTSRKPDDIPAFNRKMIEEFRQSARRTGQTRAAGRKD